MGRASRPEARSGPSTTSGSSIADWVAAKVIVPALIVDSCSVPSADREVRQRPPDQAGSLWGQPHALPEDRPKPVVVACDRRGMGAGERHPGGRGATSIAKLVAVAIVGTKPVIRPIRFAAICSSVKRVSGLACSADQTAEDVVGRHARRVPLGDHVGQVLLPLADSTERRRVDLGVVLQVDEDVLEHRARPLDQLVLGRARASRTSGRSGGPARAC